LRLTVTAVLVALSVLLAVALANGSSNLVTTLIAIPLGSIAGFTGSLLLFDVVSERRRRTRAAIRRRYADAAMREPITLTPQPRAANDNAARPPLALPAPAIAA
jgi:hypothetical protein